MSILILKPRRRWSAGPTRSEEHTSELQSQSNLVCRLLLEKKKIHEHANDPGKAVAHESVRLTEELRTPVLLPATLELTGPADSYPSRLPALLLARPTAQSQ